MKNKLENLTKELGNCKNYFSIKEKYVDFEETMQIQYNLVHFKPTSDIYQKIRKSKGYTQTEAETIVDMIKKYYTFCKCTSCIETTEKMKRKSERRMNNETK